LSEGFGAPSAVRALEGFSRLAGAAASYHPDSKAARGAGRLAYLAAAITCESLDYVSVGAAFRTLEERRELILSAVRRGALSSEHGQQTLKLAVALMEKYAPGGKSTATAVETGLKRDLARIPAEIVADQAVRLLKADQLFSTGRELEMASYCAVLPPFDALGVQTKSMLGALLTTQELIGSVSHKLGKQIRRLSTPRKLPSRMDRQSQISLATSSRFSSYHLWPPELASVGRVKRSATRDRFMDAAAGYASLTCPTVPGGG